MRIHVKINVTIQHPLFAAAARLLHVAVRGASRLARPLWYIMLFIFYYKGDLLCL